MNLISTPPTTNTTAFKASSLGSVSTSSCSESIGFGASSQSFTDVELSQADTVGELSQVNNAGQGIFARLDRFAQVWRSESSLSFLSRSNLRRSTMTSVTALTTTTPAAVTIVVKSNGGDLPATNGDSSDQKKLRFCGLKLCGFRFCK